MERSIEFHLEVPYQIYLKKTISELIDNSIKNVASIYSLYKKGIRNSVILNYDSELNDLGYWYQQLVGESLGKNDKGITPILSFAPKDHHSMLQLYLDGPKDKFYTFLNSSHNNDNYLVSNNIIPKNMSFLNKKSIGQILKAQSDATSNIFKLKKIPFRQFVFNKKKESELGEIMTFFVLETILLGRLLNLNTFDQPAVEQVKAETKKILSI